MDFFQILSSINKISIAFFIITLVVLSWELYLFKKEKERKTKINIPQFDERLAKPPSYTEIKVDEKNNTLVKKSHTLPLIGISFALIFLIAIAVIAIRNLTEEEPQPVSTRATSQSSTFIPTSPPTKTPTKAPQPTEVLLSQNQIPELTITPTATPQASPSPTKALGGTATYEARLTQTATPTQTKQESIPQAGFIQTPLLLFLIATTTILLSFIF